jgi:hypothetical protein
MSDLNRFHQRLAPPRLKEITRFREVGVSPEALSAPELPARADVVFHDDRPLFDFADDAGDGSAVAGFIFLARDDEGDPCDLVAWSPQAKRIAAWYGVAPLLGTDMLYAPRLDPEGALQVFEEPLALGVDRIIEVNVRACGFAQLCDWLEGRDLLVIRADRKEPLIVLPVKLAIQIARAAERAKNSRSSASTDDRDIGPGAEALGF